MNLQQEWDTAKPLALLDEWDNAKPQEEDGFDIPWYFDTSGKPEIDYDAPEPVLNGFMKAALTVPATFLTMAGTFPAAGIKGYATYMTDMFNGKSVDTALRNAEKDIGEFMGRIPELLMTTPEERKSLEYVGLPFEYLEKAVTLSGEGWEEITSVPYTAPVVATILNAFFLGKIPKLVKGMARTPVKLAEIRNGAKRFQKWVDEGANPVKQPVPVSEIGKVKVPYVAVKAPQKPLVAPKKAEGIPVPQQKGGVGEKGVGAKGAKAGVETPSDITQLVDSLEELKSPQLPLTTRVNNAIGLADTYSRAKDSLNRGLDNLRLVSRTLYDNAKSGELGRPKDYTEYASERDNYVGSYQISNLEAKRFGATIRKQIPDPVRREAIVNYIQAEGDIGILQTRFAQSLDNTATHKYAKGYKVAQELTGEERLFAENVRNYFDSKLQEGIEAGLLENGLENYINQIWTKDNPIANAFRTDMALGRLRPNPSFIRKRIFDDYFTGEQLGYTPAGKDIGHLLTVYDQSFNKALASRQFIRSLSDMTLEDGRPAVGVSGAGKKIEGVEIQDNDAYLIRPRVKGDELSDYRIVDHPALRKWKWLGEDETGNPLLMNGDLLVHPEIYKSLNNMLKTSAIRQNRVGKAALSTISTFKGTLLSLSGFHQTQVGLHAIFHGVNPFTTPKLDMSAPFQRAVVKKGLIIADYKNMELFHEGITSGGLIAKLPALGPVTVKYTDWLFADYIPRLKMKMAEEAYRRNTKRYRGKLTDDQIMSLTADQANAAFGELNYAKMGRDPTLQDAMRLMLLAPDFFEARARFVAQAVRPYAGLPNVLKQPTFNEQGMAAILRGSVGLYVGARVVNALLNDGETYSDKPFSVVIKGNEFVLRSIPGDVYHLINDPTSFVFHRLNPTLTKPLVEALLKRDEYGRYITAEDWVKDFFLSHVPIPLQGFTKGQRTLWQSILSSIGVSAFKYRSSLERALMEESSKYITVSVSKEEKARHILVSKYAEEIQEAIRNGKGLTDITARSVKDVKDGKLFIDDTDKILDYVKSDRTERYIKTLPIERILTVWKKATVDEQRQYFPLLLERITNMMNESPEKFQSILPQLKKILKGKIPLKQ